MKKLIFAACLLFTVTSITAAGVGENDTTCAEMIDGNRNAVVETGVAGDAEVRTEEAGSESK